MPSLRPSPALAAVAARFVADPESSVRSRAVIVGLSACLRAGGFRPERLAVPSVAPGGRVLCVTIEGDFILINADGSVVDVRAAAAQVQAHVVLVGAVWPEPYRAAANALGWGDLDGSEWWDAVMEAIG